LEWVDARDNQLEAARNSVEAWFDQSMDQVKGVYKRRVQAWLFALALGVSLVIGADTIKIVKTLSTNATLRTFVANEAVQTTKPGGPLSMTAQESPASTQPISTTVVTTTSANTTTTTTNTTAPTISAVVDEIEKLNQLFGYSDMPKIFDPEWPGAVESKIVGILITTLAVSLGAPFWFDLLQKVANIRAAGRRPESVTD
jgi:hypothetical protein